MGAKHGGNHGHENMAWRQRMSRVGRQSENQRLRYGMDNVERGSGRLFHERVKMAYQRGVAA